MKQFSPFFFNITDLFKRNFLNLILVFAFSQLGYAQVSVTSLSPILQDFNGLSSTASATWTNNSTPLTGWYSSVTSLALNNGSTNSNAVYNCGSASGTDRALGALSTATTHNFGIRLKNNGASAINSLLISFNGEQWRQNTANQSLVFEYQIGTTVTSLSTGTWIAATALDFASPNIGTAIALDGNLVANKTAKSTTISLSIPVGSEIMLRWTKAGSNSHLLAIDDLSITPTFVSTATTDFANIQFPTTTQSILQGSTVSVFAQAYEPGLTEAAGAGSGLSSWIGYSSTNDNPANAGWNWIPATFNTQAGNNDEFTANLGSGLIPGTYYYASRFQISGGPFTYGGNGGNWNNNNVQLNINSNLVDFCNIQSPVSGTITAGGVFNVFAKVYEAGVTDPAGANANVSAWIGKSTTNSNPNTGSWTWIPATFNVQIGNDDEYQANIGTGTTAGTYYYASRFQLSGSTEFRYGGIGGIWNNDSGVLTVNGASPVVTTSNQNGTVATAFSYNVVASNGPISYAIASGSLPNGLILNTTSGLINGTPTTAGSFTANITATNAGGTSPAVAINFTIAKANQTITFAALVSQVYGTAPITLAGSSTSALALTYASDNALVATTAGNIITIVGVGTANITASQVGDSNYNPATNVIRLLTVTPKPITISGLIADSKTQDGTTATTLSGTPSLVGVLAVDVANVNLVSTPVANFTSANVGTGIAVTVSGYSLSGSAAFNYSLVQPTGLTANIIALTVPIATDATNIATTSFDANWNGTLDAFSGYLLDVSTSPTFGTTTPANLTEGFASGTTAPSGWVFTSVGGTYITAGNFGVASPSLQLDATNDRVLSPVLAGNATQLSFWMKGNSTNVTSGMLVEGFNGTTWVTIQNLIGFAQAATIYTYNSSTSPVLPSNITQFRFTYTKTLGNIGFDDVNINYDLLTPSFIAGYNGFVVPLQATQTALVSPVAANTIHYYRVRAVNGSAQSANSNVITVFPLSVGGTVSADQSICSGTNPVDLTLSGSYGSIVKWQSSTTLAFGMPTDIANTTSTLTSMMMGSLSSTTYYRAVIQSGPNPVAFSSIVTITVNPNITPTFTAVAAICSGASLSALPTTSNNAITGTWAPALDNLNTTTYTFTPTSGQCATTTTLTISVGGTSTWSGSPVASWSPAAPTSIDNATISANYTSATNGGDINACSMTVDNSANVIVSSGNNITLNGKLTVTSGSFTVENNANLLQSLDIANSGNITVKRNSSNLLRQDYTLWSSPLVGAQTLLQFTPLTTQASVGPPAVSSRFYVYNTLTNTYNNSFNPASTTFASGKGYLLRMPNNWSSTTAAPYLGSFTGVPTNGDETFTLVNNGIGQRFNAIGNPYPSDISMTDFVAANTNNITGTLYFWRKTNSTLSSPGYCTWAGGTFTSNLETQVFDPSGIISVGQGFIVEAKNSSTTVDFNNGMRVANNVNQFFRNPNTIEYNRIWLNVSGNDTAITSAKSQMAVGYITDATQGEDAFDGKFFNNGDAALSSLIGTDKYAIQGRALPFNDNDVVPMSFKAATAGNYNIAIDHVDGLFTENSEIYLKDNLTGTTNNLTTGAYNFATLAGDFDTRFELVYRSGLLAITNPVFNYNAVIVYKNNAGVNVNSGTIAIANVKIFDLQGRLLIEKTKVNSNQITIDTNAFSNQLLIVEVTSTDNVKISKKVIN
jgi:YDG domain